ncbi:hypothetical protein BGZ58_000605, partial [Dissophora ornata]
MSDYNVVQILCWELQEEGHVVLQDCPCQVTSITSNEDESLTKVTGFDIFSGRECEESFETTEMVDVPIVKVYERMLLSMSDENNSVQVYDKRGNSKFIKLPEDGGMLRQRFTHIMSFLHERDS